MLEAAVVQPLLGQQPRHMAAEAADSALFHRKQSHVTAGEAQDLIAVERLSGLLAAEAGGGKG